MKNQLFRISPDMEITENILQLFGIKDMNDNHSFTRVNLIDLKTVEKIYPEGSVCRVTHRHGYTC